MSQNPHFPTTNKQNFEELLNDYFLFQLNNTPTCSNNILDFVITNVPDHVHLTEILSPEQSSVFTDNYATSFDFNALIKAPRKSVRTIYDYTKGDWEVLSCALSEIHLSSTISDSAGNIDTDWQCWKDMFLTTVSHYIPVKN